MKKWTVVLEVTDSGVQNIDSDQILHFSQHDINALVSPGGDVHPLPEQISFRIMETIEAPYGPQHPGGVFIAEMKCICRKGSSFVNPNCKAAVHHP